MKLHDYVSFTVQFEFYINSVFVVLESPKSPKSNYSELTTDFYVEPNPFQKFQTFWRLSFLSKVS